MTRMGRTGTCMRCPAASGCGPSAQSAAENRQISRSPTRAKARVPGVGNLFVLPALSGLALVNAGAYDEKHERAVAVPYYCVSELR